MFWEEVDVVGNHHQVANLEGWVHATCSIRDEECLDAQFVHDAHRERHFLHRVAFVVVESPLHGHDVNPAKLSEDEFAGVSLDGRYREVGDVAVGEL